MKGNPYAHLEIVAFLLGSLGLLVITVLHWFGIQADPYAEAAMAATGNTGWAIAAMVGAAILFGGALARAVIFLRKHQSDQKAQEHLRQYQLLVEGSSDLFCVIDADYRYTLSNEAYASLYGLQRSELEGQYVADVVGEPFFSTTAKPPIERCLAGEPQDFEAERTYEHLGTRQLLIRYYPLRADDGTITHIGSIATDITALKTARARLHEQNRLLTIAGDAARLGGWSVELGGNQVTWSPAVARIHGVPEGKTVSLDEAITFYIPEDQPRIRSAFESCAANGTPYDLELQIVTTDNERRWVRTLGLPVRDPQGQVTRVEGSFQDITAQKQVELKLNRLAYEDATTGLLTRNGFTDSISRWIDEHGWPADAIMLLLDLSGLRNINEAHGYQTGDRVLHLIGQRLLNVSGKHELVGRIGGDEFAVLLPPEGDATPENRRRELARQLGHPLATDGAEIDLSIRFGYTVFGSEPRVPDRLLQEAELALFEVSHHDPERWAIYTHELDWEVRQRIEMTRDLRQALVEEQFELHYQPKVDLTTGEMLACEALMRWRHPVHGFQPPNVFIPVAEQSQLMGPIGDWALNEACRCMHKWQENGLGATRVAVNVSVVQFRHGDFIDTVRDALAAWNIAPGQLTLEITESVFAQETQMLCRQLRALHELGVRLSLDDFGTGYSSLLYLQQFAFDEIKIDQGFVKHMASDPYSHRIVSTVLGVADALGADAVAEGVETETERKLLLELGCRYAQGYHFSMPLADEDLCWLLSTRKQLP